MKKKLTANELIARVREYAIDHEPSGWPAVQMRLLSAMADELEAMIKLAVSLEGCKACSHFAPSKKPAICHDCPSYVRWERRQK